MTKTAAVLAFAALIFAGSVRAQQVSDRPPTTPPTQPNVTGPSMDALLNVARGNKTDGEIFDGRKVIRHEGPLVILDEQKDKFLGQYESGGWGYGGYYGPAPYYYGPGPRYGGWWSYEPPRTVKVFGTRQTVGIFDRAGYAREEGKKGAGKGALFGLIPALLLLLGGAPIAALVAVGLAAAVGGAIGDTVARGKPKVFDRDVDKYTQVIYH